MRKYIVTGPRPVEGVAPGDELEHEFTAEEERVLVAAGRLEIVPSTYQVIGPNKVFEVEPGGFFTSALSLDQEQALVYGGHIELMAEGSDEQNPYKGKTRPELEEMAASAGISDADDKSKFPKKDDLVAALEDKSQPSPEGD